MLSTKMTTSTTTLICAAMAAMAAGLNAAPAHADPTRWSAKPLVRTERVFVGDLDLASSPGVTTAHARVQGAVIRVCAKPDGGPRSFMRSEMLSCKRTTGINARRQLARLIKLAEKRDYARAD